MPKSTAANDRFPAMKKQPSNKRAYMHAWAVVSAAEKDSTIDDFGSIPESESRYGVHRCAVRISRKAEMAQVCVFARSKSSTGSHRKNAEVKPVHLGVQCCVSLFFMQGVRPKSLPVCSPLVKPCPPHPNAAGGGGCHLRLFVTHCSCTVPRATYFRLLRGGAIRSRTCKWQAMHVDVRFW